MHFHSAAAVCFLIDGVHGRKQHVLFLSLESSLPLDWQRGKAEEDVAGLLRFCCTVELFAFSPTPAHTPPDNLLQNTSHLILTFTFCFDGRRKAERG